MCGKTYVKLAFKMASKSKSMIIRNHRQTGSAQLQQFGSSGKSHSLTGAERETCEAGGSGNISTWFSQYSIVSRCGLAVRRLAGKQKDVGSIRFGSPLSSCGLWTLSNGDFCPLKINETLKWLTQLLTLMQNYSGGDSVARRC